MPAMTECTMSSFARLRLRAAGSRVDEVVAGGQAHLLGDPALHFGVEAAQIAALEARRHGLQPASAGVQDLVASGRETHVCHRVQGHQAPVGRAQPQATDLGHLVANRRVEHHHQIDDAAAFVDLAHGSTAVRSLDRLHDGERLQPERGQPLMAQPDGQLRRARRRLQLDVARAGHAGDGRRHRLRVAVEQIEIGAVQVDDERRGKARDGFFDALGQERVDRESHARELVAALAGQRVADLAQDALLLLPGSAPISTSYSL